ncbi:tetratricopeptide repeat protein [Alkalilimnicola ehrlichii MLHE-1]|nr:tetratricopeptide repeat protein [Alkalilimnicola ehrlichii]
MRTRSLLCSALLSLALTTGPALAGPPPWEESAADDHSAEGQREIALAHADQEDYAEALAWLESAASAGSARAKVHLGYFHQEGLGVEADGQQALHWYQRAVEAGRTEHATRVAWAYLEGAWVTPDREAAEHWFQVAIDAGHHEAHLGIGSVLLSDVVGGGSAELAERAQGHFKAALEEGLDMGSYYLARMYREGLGIEPDPERALPYLYEGARSPDTQINAPMQAWLAEMYYAGEGMDEGDKLEAASWAWLAAANGHPDGERLVNAITAELDEAEADEAKERAWRRAGGR